MNATVGVVRSLFVDIACTGRQFCLFAVVLVTAYRNKDNDIVFIEFGKMSDFNISY
jgi:hypothetical protein